MLIRPIKYNDLDGVLRTENFHFNLSLSEVAELELDMPGGLSEHMMRAVEQRDAKTVLAIFKRLVTFAYGERTPDGKYFLKENENGYQLGRMFLQHPAYNSLFLDLLGENASDEAFLEFLTGCLPKELIDKMPSTEDIPKILEERRASGTVQSPANAAEKKATDYSREELLDMTDEEFTAVAGLEPTKMDPEILKVAFQRRATSQS